MTAEMYDKKTVSSLFNGLLTESHNLHHHYIIIIVFVASFIYIYVRGCELQFKRARNCKKVNDTFYFPFLLFIFSEYLLKGLCGEVDFIKH